MMVSGPHAPAAAARLAEAESALLALEAELGPLSLAASEGEAGADKKLATLDARITAARHQRHKLQSAHRHAILLDRKADAAGAATMRVEQLAEFELAGADRVAAMLEMLDLIAKATAAYGRYAVATNRMVVATPSGTVLPVMTFAGEPWLGNCELLIGREAFRLAGLAGTSKPSFARFPPPSVGDDFRQMQPAAEILKSTQQYVLSEIRSQVAKLDREAMSAATGIAIAPPAPPAEDPPDPPKPAPAVKYDSAEAALASHPPKPEFRPRNEPKKDAAAPAAKKAEAPAANFDPFAGGLTDAAALAGLNGLDCAAKCSADGCIITGGACAHPNKGGVQQADKARPKILARYDAACKLLGLKNKNEVAA